MAKLKTKHVLLNELEQNVCFLNQVKEYMEADNLEDAQLILTFMPSYLESLCMDISSLRRNKP